MRQKYLDLDRRSPQAAERMDEILSG